MMPRRATSDIDAAVLLALAEAGGHAGWLTAPEVVKRASGRGLNATTVYRALTRLRDGVEYRTTNRVRRFHLKQPLSDPTSVFVVAGTPWSTQRQLREFLRGNATGSLLVVDPYVSEDTLDILTDVSVPVQILSSNLGRRGQEEAFLRAYRKFRREKNGKVELRKAQSTELHGRYLFTESRGWAVDHSLQDLGTKPALILPLQIESVFGSVRAHFVSCFAKASPVV